MPALFLHFRVWVFWVFFLQVCNFELVQNTFSLHSTYVVLPLHSTLSCTSPFCNLYRIIMFRFKCYPSDSSLEVYFTCLHSNPLFFRKIPAFTSMKRIGTALVLYKVSDGYLVQLLYFQRYQKEVRFFFCALCITPCCCFFTITFHVFIAFHLQCFGRGLLQLM